MNSFLILLALITLICGNGMLADIACGDWSAYKSQKCFKVFESLQTYDEAENTCRENNSTLATIASPDEQNYIVNYLFTTRSTEDNVWIGLNYVYNRYKWVNNRELRSFTNWAQNSPKFDSVYCVQLLSVENENSTGKWSDVSCTRKNFALCEKMPSITALQLLELIMNTRKQLDNTIDVNSIKLENANKQIESLKDGLNLTNSVLEVTYEGLLNTSVDLSLTRLELNRTIRRLVTNRELLSNYSVENTEKHSNTTAELLLTNQKLEVTADLLRDTASKLGNTNRQIDYFFSNKWVQFKTFADENNRRKALFYPYKTPNSVSRQEAIELCAQNNATLVDIESVEKQKLVEAFLYLINRKSERSDYWLSGYADTDGKYKWMNSGNDFVYTNWAAGEPDSNASRYACLFFNYDGVDSGKWYSYSINNTMNVFCEITFNF